MKVEMVWGSDLLDIQNNINDLLNMRQFENVIDIKYSAGRYHHYAMIIYK